MGRRKAQSSRIRAIHYKTDDNDEIYYLDHSGRHIDRQIEKLSKPKHYKYSIKSDDNEKIKIKQLRNEFQPPNIMKTPTIPIFQFKDSVGDNQKISQNFIDLCDKFPVSSLMWINNPDYSTNLSENI